MRPRVPPYLLTSVITVRTPKSLFFEITGRIHAINTWPESDTTALHPESRTSTVLNYSTLTLWYIYPIFYFHSTKADVDCY